MIFDFAAIGSGYAKPSSMGLIGGIAWLHWFDYELCADGITKDKNGSFCNTAVYPITKPYGWPMTCGLTYVPAPAAPVQDGVPGSSIRIVEASYGKNCNGSLQGNRTDFFTTLVNGASSLQNYSYDYTKTGGDPAYGCAKTLEITYNCGGANKSFSAPPEAGYNALVNLSCPPPPAPVPPPVQEAPISSVQGNVIAAGGKSILAFSQDGGNTFTVSQSGTNIFPAASAAQVLFISNNGSQWLAGGSSQTGTKLAVSADGVNWTVVSSMNDYGGNNSSYNYAIWSGSRWIVGCTNVSRNYATEIYTSTNGQNWSVMNLKFSNITQVAASPTTIVMSGAGSNFREQHAINYSTDNGNNWNVAPTADAFLLPNANLDFVSYGGGKFVAGGCGRSDGAFPMLQYSSDGITWQRADITKVCQSRLFAAFWNGRMWLAVGNTDLLYSMDGINWNQAKIAGLDSGWYGYILVYKGAATWTGTKWIMGTKNGAITSADGINWVIQTKLAGMFNQGINAVSAGGAATASASAAPVAAAAVNPFSLGCNEMKTFWTSGNPKPSSTPCPVAGYTNIGAHSYSSPFWKETILPAYNSISASMNKYFGIVGSTDDYKSMSEDYYNILRAQQKEFERCNAVGNKCSGVSIMGKSDIIYMCVKNSC
jgi:hypothetical protein